MKQSIFVTLPLSLLSLLSTSKNKQIEVAGKDTVYVFTTRQPHKCKLLYCAYKGDLIFTPKTDDEDDATAYKIHFYNPQYNFHQADSIRVVRENTVKL